MKTILVKLVIIALLGMPAMTFAAPEGVYDIEVDYRDEKIVVSWEKLEAENIANYRIYYSAESILGNNGEYDDFEETDGPKSSYSFEKPPLNAAQIFFSVLAVDTDGEESPIFLEEVSLSLGGIAPVLPELPDFVDVAPPEDTESEVVVPPLTEVIPSSGDVPLAPLEEILPEETNTDGQGTGAEFIVPTLPPELPPAVNPGTDVPQPDPATTNQPASSVASSSVSSVAAPPQPQPTNIESDGYVHLIKAEALSPTTVKLYFNTLVDINAEDAPKAFKVVDSSGEKLQLRRLVIDGDDVQIETTTQVKGEVYEVQVSEPLQSYLLGEPLDPTDRKTFFIGHPEGKEAVTPNTPTDTIENPADVKNLVLEAIPQPNGLFTIRASWVNPLLTGGLVEYAISQSLDNGATYSVPQVVPAPMAGIVLEGVHPGYFGLKVQTLNQPGFISRGAAANIQVGQIAPPTPKPVEPEKPVKTPVASVIEQGESDLTSSGSAFVLFTFCFAGAIAGWKRSLLMNVG